MSAAALSETEARLAASSVKSFDGHLNKILSLAWNCDGTWLASGSADATVRLWKIDTKSETHRECRVLSRHSRAVSALVWHPTDPSVLVSAADDGYLLFWSIPPRGDASVTSMLRIHESGLYMAWHAEARVLAVGTSEDKLVLVDMSSVPAIIASIPLAAAACAAIPGSAPSSFHLNEFAWAPHSAKPLLFAAMCCACGPLSQGSVLILDFDADFKNAHVLTVLPAHAASANALRFQPQGKLFATGGSDSMVCLWDVADLACIATFDRLETMVRCVAFSHDGALLVTGSDDPVSEVIRVADGSRVFGIPQDAPMDAMAWSPVAHTLAFATSTDKRVDKNPVRILFGRPAPVTA